LEKSKIGVPSLPNYEHTLIGSRASPSPPASSCMVSLFTCRNAIGSVPRQNQRSLLPPSNKQKKKSQDFASLRISHAGKKNPLQYLVAAVAFVILVHVLITLLVLVVVIHLAFVLTFFVVRLVLASHDLGALKGGKSPAMFV
jgi:hypothetical protein